MKVFQLILIAFFCLSAYYIINQRDIGRYQVVNVYEYADEWNNRKKIKVVNVLDTKTGQVYRKYPR
tara:strand:+ start:3257 stop:3454 length:198 start_codon:yes stop_codon:yes gene_type:complete